MEEKMNEGAAKEEKATVKDILGQIDTEIDASGAEVLKRVKSVRVEKEVEARKEAVLVVLGKFEEAKKALAKIQPDQKSYPVVNGVMADKPMLHYSETKKKELDKATETVKRLEEALVKALFPNKDGKYDFSKVKELAKSGGGEVKHEGD